MNVRHKMNCSWSEEEYTHNTPHTCVVETVGHTKHTHSIGVQDNEFVWGKLK